MLLGYATVDLNIE